MEPTFEEKRAAAIYKKMVALKIEITSLTLSQHLDRSPVMSDILLRNALSKGLI